MAVTPSAERLSDIIGSIYDCALDQTQWEPTLLAICREFNFLNSVLGVVRLPSGEFIHQASVGIAPEWRVRAAQMGPEIVEMWGGPARIMQYPLDEPIINSDAVDRSLVRDNRYLREWVEPQGIVDAVAISIARDTTMHGNIAFGRHGSAGAVGDVEVSGLRLLAPHFRRAVTIGNLFDMKAIEAATFASVVDSFSFGLILVNEHLGIVHANPVAAAMLTARDPVESHSGVLSMPGRAAHEALARAVQQATLDEASLGQGGIGIPARRSQGTPCVLHVLPLKRGELRRGVARPATAAIFLTRANAPPAMPRDALALLYDLTPAEARVFELIADGRTQEEVGEILGIARSTVKTHLLRVFDKTGCTRQVDLVRLAARLSMPA